MTPLKPAAMIALMAVAMALSACGSAATATTVSSSHWWPSTPLPTPGPANATPTALPSPSTTPAGVGQSAPNGLGTPASTVSATAQLLFSPTTVTVKTGAVVQWTNTGSVPHNVTFDTHQDLSSGTLSQGNTWQVQFSTAGTYSYKCTFHPGMNGQVTVSG